jgi:hypothetical protein
MIFWNALQGIVVALSCVVSTEKKQGVTSRDSEPIREIHADETPRCIIVSASASVRAPLWPQR